MSPSVDCLVAHMPRISDFSPAFSLPLMEMQNDL